MSEVECVDLDVPGQTTAEEKDIEEQILDQFENENSSKEVASSDLDSSDKIDELTSLEREIAILHHVEPTPPSTVQKVSDPISDGGGLSDDEAKERVIVEMQTVNKKLTNTIVENDDVSSTNRVNGEDIKNQTVSQEKSDEEVHLEKSDECHEVLENDDLIAVLKGIDDETKITEVKVEGVTIEGEGEYPVIEIDDNDTDGAEENPLSINGEKTKKLHEGLTAEEARKVALEQMEMIKFKARRRKQDIKPIQQPADLVTSLVSEWSDDETSQENAKGSKAKGRGSKKESKQQAKKEPGEISPPTGFKRTRVIKRKIIWDPDAPETQFSYATLVKPSSAIKKEPAAKKGRITPQKKESIATTSNVTVAPNAKASKLSERPQTPAAAKSQNKRQTDTPVQNGNKKKRYTEIDRLLGDEGAINMLNSLENEQNKKIGDGAESSKPNVRIRNATPTPEKAIKKEQPATKIKRTPRPKASDSWDYVYKKQTEDSMIIRRRSNSSYSSSASNRVSLDGPTPPKLKAASAIKSPASAKSPAAAVSTKVTVTPETASKQSGKQFEFAKPENKIQTPNKMKAHKKTNPLPSDMKKAVSKRVTRSDDDKDKSSPSASNSSPPAVKKEPIERRSPVLGSEKDFTVTMIGKVAQIVFNTKKAKIPNTFPVQLLNMLTNTLDGLSEDKNCNVAVVLSNNDSFCKGIDFSDIANGSAEKRKTIALQMAKAVKNFLQTLATFPKPIIAGVTGSNSGLGVTMLPLFDIVVGSNQATFEAPYARIGQLPEGYCIWSESSKIKSSTKTNLLWLCKKLDSTESVESGLVNILASPSSVNEEALKCAKEISSFSTEAYKSMKKSTIESNLENILTGLEEEHDTLSEQWISQECVESFKHFIKNGQWPK